MRQVHLIAFMTTVRFVGFLVVGGICLVMALLDLFSRSSEIR